MAMAYGYNLWLASWERQRGVCAAVTAHSRMRIRGLGPVVISGTISGLYQWLFRAIFRAVIVVY